MYSFVHWSSYIMFDYVSAYIWITAIQHLLTLGNQYSNMKAREKYKPIQSTDCCNRHGENNVDMNR